LLEGGNVASAHGVAVLADRGLDLAAHRSRVLTADLLSAADVIVGMARMHVREAVVQSPALFPRTFTLKELVRRGEEVGARRFDEPVGEWLARLHDGRSPRDLLGDSPDDDIADPIGQPRKAYERMVAELEPLVDKLVGLVWPEAVARSVVGSAEGERTA
jgi:protein-tyrosine phosphatase